MKATLIAVGTELVIDGRPDTNGAAIARLLAARGIETAARILLPDDERGIARCLLEASENSSLLIVTGGLGPTLDDVTREAASRAFDRELVRDPEILTALGERYRTFGRVMGADVERQADVPDGAEVLPNPIGTAPGLLMKAPSGALVFLLPGVPSEMDVMLREQVQPRLEREMANRADSAAPLVARGLKVCGLMELEAQRSVEDLLPRGTREAPTLTLLASPGEVTLIVRGRDAAAVERAHQAAIRRLGPFVFSEQADDTLESVAGRMLAERGLTLAVAESCTGGLLGSLITGVPGSSAWFLQGWVTYSNESKVRALGVDRELLEKHGAVSAPVAESMAGAARRLSGADYAISITGIAGPDGGAPDKPVGLVYIALSGGPGSQAEGPAGAGAASRHRFPGDRRAIRLFAARTALDRLRRALAGHPDAAR
ncbi:MAG TPA: CinA family nicotinamide mononucleotide deamidase-related protein [Candidatus Polarisedimenticolia bacterium]|nr:CinA family nicotinamide mononucleotide deamidase-related protein [Candidatus Polarisedimenticolia bacterium]